MVATVHAPAGGPAPDAASGQWEAIASRHSGRELALLTGAAEYARERCADARTADGERLIDRAIGTATIVSGLNLDADAVCAALLVGLPAAHAFDAEDVTTRFGADVGSIVAGVARMDEIRAQPPSGHADERAAQAERLRKMLLAMVEDIRVVVVKLAERTHALRYLMGAGEPDRRAAAREVLDLFAPLANRLGIWQLKWELEDLSLRALEERAYKEIAKALETRRTERERDVDDVVGTLSRELAASGIAAEVSGRPKHIYSIWNKMRRKDVGIEALYDIRAVRVLVEDVAACYAALGVVHHHWTPIPGEFDDYIARPKANRYRSLHTAVAGPGGKPLEVQIRTHEMHSHSEFGVAAHWRYKEQAGRRAGASRHDPGLEERIDWLRQVLDWRDSVADSADALAAFKTSLFTDTIYVLTPQGKVIDLPRGATPVDFAYTVHTSLGHRCRGARVDGAMVPLHTPLRNGQRVEIITAKQGGPSRDWLNPELGFVLSHRARLKVRQWFKAQQLEETIAHGRAEVEREMQRAGATAVNLDQVAAAAGFDGADALFAAAARDEINVRQIQAAIRAVVAPAEVSAREVEAELAPKESRSAGAGSGIQVVGVDRLMTALARCCKPAPPDPIVGFVTRGRGVSIHRVGCASIARMRAREPERLIEATWGARRDEVFPVDVVLEGVDRQGLLRDVTEVFSREKINVTAARTQTRDLEVRMAFTLEVASLAALSRALALVAEVRGVSSATRR